MVGTHVVGTQVVGTQSRTTDASELVDLDARGEVVVERSVIDAINPPHQAQIPLKRHRRLLSHADPLHKLDGPLKGTHPIQRVWDLLVSELPRVLLSLVIAAATLAAALAALYWLAQRYLPTEL